MLLKNHAFPTVIVNVYFPTNVTQTQSPHKEGRGDCEYCNSEARTFEEPRPKWNIPINTEIYLLKYLHKFYVNKLEIIF